MHSLGASSRPGGFEPGQKARDFIHAVLREINTAAAVEAFNRRYKWHRKRGGQLPTSEWFNLLLRQELGGGWTLRFGPLSAAEVSVALGAFVR